MTIDNPREQSAPTDPGEPLVTVLLPSLRVDAWLRVALDSVLNDGYGNLEVILLLDGIGRLPGDQWLLQDPRVRVIPFESRVGIARALNVGLSLAKGEYIARMDGDDVSLPGRFSAQVRELQSNSRVAVVGCQAIRIDEHGAEIGAMDVPTTEIKRCLLLRNSLIHPTIMFRKSAVLDIGAYSEAAKATEDYDLYLRLAMRYELRNLPDRFLKYRVHSAQTSRGFNPFSLDKWGLLHRRRLLARKLKSRLMVQLVRDCLWAGAQVSRYFGWRKPTVNTAVPQ
jgi:glycosyltransferase involved in cell wall biosynthesis